MSTRIQTVIKQLSPTDLERWYRKLKEKKNSKGLTASQNLIYKTIEDRLWFEYRV